MRISCTFSFIFRINDRLTEGKKKSTLMSDECEEELVIKKLSGAEWHYYNYVWYTHTFTFHFIDVWRTLLRYRTQPLFLSIQFYGHAAASWFSSSWASVAGQLYPPTKYRLCCSPVLPASGQDHRRRGWQIRREAQLHILDHSLAFYGNRWVVCSVPLLLLPFLSIYLLAYTETEDAPIIQCLTTV